MDDPRPTNDPMPVTDPRRVTEPRPVADPGPVAAPRPTNAPRPDAAPTRPAPASRGRPRSEAARRAVLDAALELCQRDGYQDLTIKAIAERAGVGRQTVYRWWPAKEDVLLDALRDLGLRETARLDQDTGDALRDAERILDATFALTSRITGKALVGLMALAQHDPDLSARLQGTVIGPRRQALRRVLERGVERGQLTAEVDGEAALDLAVDFAFGTMWYRLLSHHAPVDSGLARRITTALRRMLTPAG